MNKKLIKQEEQPVYAEIPSRPVATITQGKKTNRLVKGVNNYFGELKYKLNNNEIPTGKYTIPAVFLAAATGPSLIKSLVFNPIGFAKGLGWSIAGGEGVNAGSKIITGKTWGENVNELTGLDEDIADYTNVGYLLGPKVGKTLKNGISKVINKPAVYEILPNGKEVKLSKFNKKLIDQSNIYDISSNSKLPQKKTLPIKETLTNLQLKFVNNIFGKKPNIVSQFIPDKKSLYNFGEQSIPSNYLRSRLETGGWDKLGISEDSYIMIPKTHRLNNSISAKYIDLKPVYNNDDFFKVNTRKFILSSLMKKAPTTISSSHYDPSTSSVYINENDWEKIIEPQIKKLLDTHPDLIRNLKNISRSHEDFHLTHHSSMMQEKNRNKLNDLDVLTKISEDKVEFPGFDYNTLDDVTRKYFTRSRGTEMMARFSQLRDYYGIYDSNQPLTLKQWNHAKQHYPYNNNMREFFNGVIDPKTFLNYMNKIVPISAAAIYGLSNITENKENEE